MNNRIKLILNYKYTHEFLWLLVILMANAVFLEISAFRTFNFLDMGSHLGAAWRVYNGQEVYRDFIYNAGPLHIYTNVFFFKIFGFTKIAILAHLLTISSPVIVLTFLITRKYTPFYIALLATILTTVSFYWNISHPWWDHSAHFWGIIALSLLVWKIPFKNNTETFWVSFFCALFSLLSALAKTNIGCAYLFVFFCVLMSSSDKNEVRSFLGFLLGCIVGAVMGFLLIRHPKEFIDQISTFNSLLGDFRLQGLMTLKNWFINYYWAAPLIVLINFKSVLKNNIEFALLIIGIGFVGAFATLTGGIMHEANIYLWGIQIALGFIILYKTKDLLSSDEKKAYKTSKGLLIILALFFTGIALKQGFELKVWRYYNDDSLGRYIMKTKPFDGWTAHMQQAKPLDDFAFLINNHIPKDHTVMNLTDMYILDIMVNRQGFKGLPYAFYGNVLPAIGQQAFEVRQKIVADPPEWIIIHDTAFEKELKNMMLQTYITRSYDIVQYIYRYMLLKRSNVTDTLF